MRAAKYARQQQPNDMYIAKGYPRLVKRGDVNGRNGSLQVAGTLDDLFFRLPAHMAE